MRIVSVFGVLALGMGLGSAAVMTPLILKSAPSDRGTADRGSEGASGWSQLVGQLARSLEGPAQRPAEPESATAGSKPAAPASGQSARTFDYLARPSAAVPSKHADAHVVETPWTTQVASEPATPRKLTSSKPNSEEQRRSLVLDLQNELKRVGCFDGEADGHWGASSKRAMAAFTDRVNASLPFEQPDFILLTLVQGHAGRACGKTCPSGQGLADNGRCIPHSILARAEKSTDKTDKQAGHGTATQPQIAQPQIAAAAVTSAWTTNTVRSAVETGSLPYRQTVPQPPRAPNAVAAALPSAVPVPVPAIRPRSEPAPVAVAAADVVVRSAPPLPGRMTIGGPQVLQAPVDAKPAADRIAAAAMTQPDSAAPEPVTAADVPADVPDGPVKEGKRERKPAAHTNYPNPPAAAHPKRAPEPVVVHRPPPKPYAPPRTASATEGMSKSRRLVYEMFQRPDRN